MYAFLKDVPSDDTVRDIVASSGNITTETALTQADTEVARICDAVLSGKRIDENDARILFAVKAPHNIRALVKTADTARNIYAHSHVSFVITRNINFTNVCNMGCAFCGFAKQKDAPDAEFLSIRAVVARAREAQTHGASEVCIQGGLHPHMRGSYYAELTQAIATALPDIHIHAFSPFEIWFGARKQKQSYRDFLSDLQEAGLGSLPGTAAEILDTDVRKRLSKDKLTTDQWQEIITTAHTIGIPTTATMMYGHIDSPDHWITHLARIRAIQDATGGFSEFVPLGFVHFDAPLYTENNDVRPGPTFFEHILVHAVSRVFLAGSIDNIQASWVKMGPDNAALLLAAGVNDLGGTLMNESISRASGASFGEAMTPHELITCIHNTERPARERDTCYATRTAYPVGVLPNHIPPFPLQTHMQPTYKEAA